MPGVALRLLRLGAAAAAAVLAAACSSCGGDGETPGAAGGDAGGGEARWEPVAQFTGVGDQRSAGFQIGAGASRWRVTVSCEGSGRVRVRIPASAEDLVAVTCPGEELGFSVAPGANVLDVVADGSWAVAVDQQIAV